MGFPKISSQDSFIDYLIKISIFLIFVGLLALIIPKFVPGSQISQRSSIIINQEQLPTVKVSINHQLIVAQVASTPQEQYQGLSDRATLCPNCGMLFNFNNHQEREFVMRRMHFPLDIIFINQKRIVNIAANLAPASQGPLKIYKSGGPADQVLEVNANYSKQHSLKIGDQVIVSS